MQFTVHEIDNQPHEFIINNVSSIDNSMLKLANKTNNESTVITNLLDGEDEDDEDSTENDFGDMEIKLDVTEIVEHFDIKQEVRHALKTKLANDVKKVMPRLKRAFVIDDRNSPEQNVPEKASLLDGTSKTNKNKRKPYSELSSIEKRRELNRAAQLRSRARKKQRVKDMESEMEKLKVDFKDLNTKYEVLKKENAALKEVLLKHENCSISQNPSISMHILIFW